MKHRLTFHGCSPVPLAHYLKALGVLRVVGEQVDDRAAGCWERDRFVLDSTLNRESVIDFFLNRLRARPYRSALEWRLRIFPQGQNKCLGGD